MATKAELDAANTRIAELEAALADKPESEALPPPIDELPANNVIEAINRVKRDLPGIGKTDSSPDLNYKFRGIETLTAHLQGLTARHGIVIMPAAIVSREIVEFTVKSGATWTEARITFRWAVYGPDGPEDVIYGESVGHGRDNADKQGSKAMTQAYKEFCIKLFCIGDKSTDPDHAAVGEEGERFDRSQDTNGKVLGTGQPPPEPGFDWCAAGWTDIPLDKLTPEQKKAAIDAFEAEMKEIRTALEPMDPELRAKLMETRNTVLGKMPYTRAQVTVWAKMADAALREWEGIEDAGAEQIKEAFPGATEDEPDGID